MRDSHALTAHTLVELRPLFDGEMWTLGIGSQYHVADNAGLEKLRKVLEMERPRADCESTRGQGVRQANES